MYTLLDRTRINAQLPNAVEQATLYEHTHDAVWSVRSVLDLVGEIIEVLAERLGVLLRIAYVTR